MEHITVIELEDGFVKLVPEHGYKILDTRTNRTYSEAVIKEKDMRFFIAE